MVQNVISYWYHSWRPLHQHHPESWRRSETILSQLTPIGNVIVILRWLTVRHIILTSCLQTSAFAPSGYPEVILRPTGNIILLGNPTFWFQITVSLHKPKSWVPSLTNILVHWFWWPYERNTFDGLTSSPLTSSPSSAVTTPSTISSVGIDIIWLAYPVI